MAIKYLGASEQQKKSLDHSQYIIRKSLKQNVDLIPKPLLDQLRAILDNAEMVIELEVKDDAALGVTDTQAHWAYWGSGGGRYIEINSRCFGLWMDKAGGSERPPRLTAVLLHELIHIAGGEELDAEFFENRLFQSEDGALPPTGEDEESFKGSGYKGQFVLLDPKTRKVSDLLQPGHDLGFLKRADVIMTPLVTPPSSDDTLQSKIAEKGAPMAKDGKKQLAKTQGAKPDKKKRVGVRVVVEITGYMDEPRLNTFLNEIRTTLCAHVEGNGGGGS